MLEAGKKIGSYILVRKLGAGGFGEVWQAEKHTKLSVNNFALKFFRPKEEDKLTLDKEKREIGIWQKVSGMPNIISIIEADEFEEYIYVVSEFADGGSLENQMTGNPFPIEKAVTIIMEILSGLNSLHQMAFVHRDVKPANILIRRGVYCLADFGISREMKAHSKSTQTAGTYEYMSPESFENRPVTIHSDLWAVGVIMQQLLTGSPPFPQKEIPSLIYSILNREPEEMPPSIPAELRDIVKKSLEKNPQNRFSSAAEMLSALKYQQMLSSKPEWEKSSQQTLVWEGNAPTERYTGNQISQPVVVPIRNTGEPQKTQPTGDTRQSHNFMTPNVPAETRKKSKRPLIFAILGGSALLVLLIAVAGAAFVYQNTNLFTKNAANNNQISNVNSNANANVAQKGESGMEIKPSPKTETTLTPANTPETVPTQTVVTTKPTPEAPRRRIDAPPATPKPTPVRPQPTPKKAGSDCIFTGDC